MITLFHMFRRLEERLNIFKQKHRNIFFKKTQIRLMRIKTTKYEMKNTLAGMNHCFKHYRKKDSGLEGTGIETKIKHGEKYIFLMNRSSVS